MAGLGAPEMILIALVILLMFGGKKIPEMMRGLGKGMKEFKDAKDGINDEPAHSPVPVVEEKALQE